MAGTSEPFEAGSRNGSTGPFRRGGAAYAAAGWTGIVPVQKSTKLIDLKGVSGRDGSQTLPHQYTSDGAVRRYAHHNIGIRLAKGIIGLDVDQYGSKHGADQMRELEKVYGDLPKTWSSTSRGTGPSRIMFFRVPEDCGELKGNASEDTEVIQHHHRYAIVWPSQHTDSGREYRWYGPDGTVSGRVPSPDELAALPDRWLEYLQKPQRDHGPGAGLDVGTFIETYTRESDPQLVDRLRTKFESREGCRHDTMLKALGWMARAAVEGQVNAGGVIGLLEEDWDRATGGGRENEFWDLVSTAVADAPEPEGPDKEGSSGEAPMTLLETMRSKLLDRAALKRLPAPEYMVKGWLKVKSSARMNGDPGSGKSLHLLDMAGCIGSGIPWQGCETRQGLVIYVIAEGIESFKLRVAAWELQYGREMENVIFYPEPVQILGRAFGQLDQSEEWKVFRELCADLGPSLVILDTQRRVTTAAEENSPSDLQKAVDALDRLKRDTGCTWMLGHHTPKNGNGGSGGGSMWGAVDTEFETSKSGLGVGARFYLKNTKQKDGADGGRMAFTLNVHDVTDELETDAPDPWGDRLTSVALSRVDPEEGAAAADPDDLDTAVPAGTPAKEQIVLVLRRVFGDQKFTRAEAKALLSKEGMMPKTFLNKWGELIKEDRVANVATARGEESTKFVVREPGGVRGTP